MDDVACLEFANDDVVVAFGSGCSSEYVDGSRYSMAWSVTDALAWKCCSDCTSCVGGDGTVDYYDAGAVVLRTGATAAP